MSKVSSNSPQGQGKTVAAVSEQSSPNKPSRPGWLEIVVGLVIYAIVGFGGQLAHPGEITRVFDQPVQPGSTVTVALAVQRNPS